MPGDLMRLLFRPSLLAFSGFAPLLVLLLAVISVAALPLPLSGKATASVGMFFLMLFPMVGLFALGLIVSVGLFFVALQRREGVVWPILSFAVNAWPFWLVFRQLAR